MSVSDLRPVHAYCSYFDSGYLSRGLTLIESLRRHGDDSPVWVLAMDEPTKRYLDELDDPSLHTLGVHGQALSSVEQFHEQDRIRAPAATCAAPSNRSDQHARHQRAVLRQVAVRPAGACPRTLVVEAIRSSGVYSSAEGRERNTAIREPPA